MIAPARSQPINASRRYAMALLTALLALVNAGCVTTQVPGITSSLAAAPATPAAAPQDGNWRRVAAEWGARYHANPADPTAAINYARALRELGQRAQAVSVLEQASIHHPRNMPLLGAYGRALADIGSYQQALDVLSRAHTPDQPDWHILSVQGAVLDQMGRHEDAQRHYATALKIAPDEPSILSNLGLSYALSRNLPAAEGTLRRAAARSHDPRVTENLALVVGLQGRFAEAEQIARADLPPDQAAANVAYLRRMLAQHNAMQTDGPGSRSASKPSRS
jgi:Flp pilus assembly protein TadD